MTDPGGKSAPPGKKILVLGATGVIGKVITSALIDAKFEFERIAIFTSDATTASKGDLIESFKSAGVGILVGDINKDDDVLKAYEGFDTIVSAVGRNAIEKQIDLIRLAEKSSTVTRFIPSEYGTDIEYNASSCTEKPHQKKLAVREYIKTSVKRVRHTYLVTGPFADLYMGNMAHEPNMGSFDVVNKRATLLGDGDGRVSLTTMADVGRLLVAVLLHPWACDNRAIRANSYTTTPNAVLKEFERQSGSSWEVAYTSLPKLRTLEQEAWDNGNPLASLYTLRRIWTEGGTLYEETENAAIEMEKMDTLEMSVQEALWKPTAGYQSGKL
ncbi:isoflavone reductase family protein [Xylariaceae sp. FL0016]|nr:isoflavone reductase family protein [Xylariaceae sp. FL0016]